MDSGWIKIIVGIILILIGTAVMDLYGAGFFSMSSIIAGGFVVLAGMFD